MISLENANSTVEVGDGATGIYSKDGNVDLSTFIESDFYKNRSF